MRQSLLFQIFTTALLLISLSLFCSASGANTKRSRLQNGISSQILWLVDGFVETPLAIRNRSFATSLMGKGLEMGEDFIGFDGRKCENIFFQPPKTYPVSYLTKIFDINKEQVQYAEDHIMIIRSNCHLEGFGEFIRLADRRLLVRIRGIVFIFSANINY